MCWRRSGSRFFSLHGWSCSRRGGWSAAGHFSERTGSDPEVMSDRAVEMVEVIEGHVGCDRADWEIGVEEQFFAEVFPAGLEVCEGCAAD